MAEFTPNYNLKKPSEEDFYNVKDFNDNADIIDQALKAHDDALATKETPAGAQAKAHAALNAAKAYTDQQVGEMQTDIENSYLKKTPQVIPPGTNLNNVTTPGYYIGGNLVNGPGGFMGAIFLEVYGDGTNIIQRATLPTGTPVAYFRMYRSGGWSAWLQLVTGDEPTPVGIPRGIIVMWSGSVNEIPEGWALCDGTNGTPDLRDRFIVGAGNEYKVGDIGGSNKVTLTISQLPSHSHSSGTLSTNSAGSHSHGSGTLSTSTTGSHTHTIGFEKDFLARNTGKYPAPLDSGSTTTSSSGSHSHSISGSTSSAGSHSHSVTGDTSSVGGGEAHENRPPYYALAFIMKL